jgi:uncharacterized membrane protein YidH (DUF202 family)
LIESNERVEQFKSEIADMRIKDPATARDALLLRAGVALMVVGVAVTIIAYFMSHNTTDALSQNDDQVIAMIGIAVSVVGSATFLRYSYAQFQRFWLARLIYEQRAQTDRILGTASSQADRM